VILGTAGHIDHGKTTLVRALTGVDTDRLPEEKRRGITIELGFAPLVLDGVGTIGVVDVPGHEAFVRTMVAGATGIDLALVVVAADEGVMPQTREHLAILQLLGVTTGVIALTKADLVDAEWMSLVQEDVRTATQASLPGAPVIATSATTGAGLDELRAALRDLARAVPARASADLFRLPIDRAFSIKGTGTVVTGTVWSGRLDHDQVVRILPGDRSARARGIQSHGAQLDAATAGSRAAIALAGVDVGDVARGSVLVTDAEWRATTLIRADVTLVPGAESVLRPRTWHRFHVGTSEVGARVVSAARSAEPGEPIAARVVLDAPVVLRAGDRFILRSSAPVNTLGGGVVVDPYAPRRAKPWPVGATPKERLRLMVDDSGSSGIPLASLTVRVGASFEVCMALLSRLADSIVLHAGRAFPTAALAELETTLVDAVRDHHRANPLEAGAPLQLLRSRLRAPVELIDLAIERKIGDHTLQLVGTALGISGWSATPTQRQAELIQRLGSVLEEAGREPPSVEELSALIGTDAGPLIRFLERDGQIVQVERDRYYGSKHLRGLIDSLRTGMTPGKEYGPAELREILGFSRKYLIPFLEYCDRAGYTIRGSVGRVWRGV
jgi:selenocysteine-specific elongation factor